MSLRNRCVDDDVSTFRALRAEKSTFLFPASSLFLLLGETPPRRLDIHWGKLLDLQADGQADPRAVLAQTGDKLHEHDLGLLDPDHEDGEGYVVQAGSN